MKDHTRIDLLAVTADLVAAYVGNNSVPAAELPGLLVQVHGALAGLSAPASAEPSDAIEKATPAQIRKSITPDALISFVDGKPYKTLRRHLTTNGLTIEAYRTRYGLPSDYPSVRRITRRPDRRWPRNSVSATSAVRRPPRRPRPSRPPSRNVPRGLARSQSPPERPWSGQERRFTYRAPLAADQSERHCGGLAGT